MSVLASVHLTTEHMACLAQIKTGALQRALMRSPAARLRHMYSSYRKLNTQVSFLLKAFTKIHLFFVLQRIALNVRGKNGHQYMVSFYMNGQIHLYT